MDSGNVPVGFGFAMLGNTAAMNRFSHLPEDQQQNILAKAHHATSQEDIYTLVANLANGQL